MKDTEVFREVVELIRKGEPISQEELVDACGYAADGVNELYVLLHAFREGFRAQQVIIERKQSIIEAKIREIENKNRTIWVLNRKLQSKGGGGDVGQ